MRKINLLLTILLLFLLPFFVQGACTDPSSLSTLNITDTSAEFTWVSDSGFIYVIEYQTAGFVPGSGIIITGITGLGGGQVTVGGLSAATTYDWYVLIDCGADSSNNIGPVQFGTLGNPSACGLNMSIPDNGCGVNELEFIIPVSGASGTQLGTDVAFTDVDIIIEHPWDSDLEITLKSPNGVEVILSSGNGGSGANYGDPTDSICSNTTNFSRRGTDGAIGNGLAPFIGSYSPDGNFNDFNDGSNPNGNWTLIICDRVGGNAGELEYVTLAFGPPCLNPINLAANNLTSTEAELTWMSSNGGASYFVEWGIAGFTPSGVGSIGTTSGTSAGGMNSITVSGLPAFTDLTFYVTEDCGRIASDTIGPEQFKTLKASDVCSGAMMVTCGDVIVDSTLTATNTGAPAGVCVTDLSTAPGLWYKFVGNGLEVTASTCGATNFDTKIGVFEGPCLALTCVTGDDDGCGSGSLQSSATFNAEIGVDYYIYVTAFLVNTGTFQLSVTCAADLVINEIDYMHPGIDTAEFVEIKNNSSIALDLDMVDVVLIDGTGGVATPYDTINLPSVMLDPAGYYVICGDAAGVSNCDLNLNDIDWLRNGSPDAVALVLNGVVLDVVSYNGDVPGWVEGSGVGLVDDSTVANIGISRLPDGGDTDTNNVDFSQRCLSPGISNISQASACTVPNDSCANATVIDPITGYFWSNVGATTDGPDATGTACDVGGETNINQDIWYSFTPVCNGIATWSTCDQTSVDTRLAVYSGTCPTDNTNFIDCNDDGVGCTLFTSELTWAVSSGVTYYLRLGTFAASTTPGTGTFDLILTDTVAPVISCAVDQFKSTDPSSCSATVAVNAPTVSDNCGTVTVVNDYNGTDNATDIYPLGITTITWTATDQSGNVDTCTQDVTVTDDENPIITCGFDQTQTADSGMCSAVVSISSPVVSDNCAVVSLINDFNGTRDASDTYLVGLTLVTWTVTDTSGNIANCSQTITITDDEYPVITCPADVVIPVCDSNAVVSIPVSGDNCTIASIVNNYNGTNNASDLYPLGTTMVRWTVTDPNGNTASCVMQITRNTPPLAAITPDPAEACVAADYLMDANLIPGSGAIVNETWNGLGLLVPTNQTEVTFNVGVPGTFGVVTYEVRDANNCTAYDTIAVAVLENPEGNIIPDVIEVCAGVSTQLDAAPSGGSGAYISHVWNGDSSPLSNSSLVNPVFTTTTPGVYNLGYVVTDSKGCKGIDDLQVVVNDNPTVNIMPDSANVCTGSLLTLNGNPSPGVGVINSHLWTGDTAPLSATNIANPDFNTMGIGTFNLIYSVEDDKTCIASDTTSVTVNPLPVVSFTGLAVSYCLSDGSATLTGIPAGGTFSGTGITGNVFDPASAGAGTFTITYTSSGINGCVDSTSQNVLVNPATNVDAGLDVNICVNDTATLTVIASGSYNWSTGDTTASIRIAPANTTTYSVTVTNTFGCVGQDSVTVTVNPPPIASFTGLASDYCVGEAPDTLLGSPTWGIFSGLGVSTVGAGIDISHFLGSPVLIPSSTTTILDLNVTGVTGTNLGTDVKLDQICIEIEHTWVEDLDIVLESPSGTMVVLFDRECPGGDNDIDICVVPGVGALAPCSNTPPPVVSGTITAALGYDLDSLNDGSNPNGTWKLHITDNVAGNDGNLLTWTLHFNSTGITTFDPGISGVGQHRVIYDYTDENGCIGSFTPLTEVHPIPVANAGRDTSICIGESATLIASGGSIYSWNTGDSTASIIVTPTDTTSYWVIVADSFGCQSADTVQVTVQPTPIVSAGVDQTICEGESAVLTASGGTSYIWNTGDTTGTLVVNPSDTTIYWVAVSNAAGCSDSDTVVVNVNPKPTANAGSDRMICAGETVTIVATGGGSYSWNIGAMSDTIIVTPAITTIYIVTVTDSNGCVDLDSITVRVNQIPVASFTGLLSDYCSSDQAATLTGIPAGGTFSGPGMAGSIFNPSVAGVGTHTIQYAFTDSFGCFDSASSLVTVTQSPTVSFTGLLSDYCVDTAIIQLTGTPAGGTFSGPGISGSTFITFFAGVGIHQVTYTYTDSNTGCDGNSSQTVEVHALPVVSIVNLDSTFCSADSAVILTGNPAGGVFSGNGVNGNIFSPPSVVFGVPNVITYTFSDSFGCGNVTSSIVRVYPNPVPVILGIANPYCENEGLFSLSATPTGGIFSGTGVLGNEFNPAVAGSGSHLIAYDIVDGNGCGGSAAATIVVNGKPNVSFTGLNSEYCVNDAIVFLTGTPTGGTFSGSGVIGNTFDPSLPGTGGPYTIIYTHTDSLGCGDADTQLVTILNAPFVFIAGFNSPYCSTDGVVTVSGTPAGGIFTGAGMNGNDFNPAIAGVGTHVILYSFTNSSNCSDVASETIVVDVCIGIEDISQSLDVIIYPNPTSGLFKIEIEGMLDRDAELSIYNIEGKIVYSETIGEQAQNYQNQIDLSVFAKGMYYVKLYSNEHVFIEKLVVQ